MRLGLMTGHGLAVGDADGLAAAMLFPHQIPGAQLPGGVKHLLVELLQARPRLVELQPRSGDGTRRGRSAVSAGGARCRSSTAKPCQWSNSSIGEDLRGSVLSTTAAKGLRKISTCCRMM